MTEWRSAYQSQKGRAKKRGIPFLLTEAQWQQIWDESGKWHLRGRGKGKYCMSRFFDRGAYEIGNVRIVLNKTNTRLGTLGRKHSPEQLAKMSAAHKGRKLSPEHVAKLVAINTGRKCSAETIAKLVAINTGRKHSAESRKKMSDAKKGKRRKEFSPEHRAKMRAARKGKPGHKHSAESRAKIGAVHRGKIVSAETRKKLSKAAKRQHAKSKAKANPTAPNLFRVLRVEKRI
jgi:NUMOD3 motif